jgi:hypothetical protein
MFVCILCVPNSSNFTILALCGFSIPHVVGHGEYFDVGYWPF